MEADHEFQVKAMMRRITWRTDGEHIIAELGDLHHRVCEARKPISEHVVREGYTVLMHWFAIRLGELVKTGGIKRWPSIRLIDGMPRHIDGVDGGSGRQISTGSA